MVIPIRGLPLVLVVVVALGFVATRGQLSPGLVVLGAVVVFLALATMRRRQ